MKKSPSVLPIILVVGLVIAGAGVAFVATRPKSPAKQQQSNDSSIVDESLPQNKEITVTLVKSKTKDNTVVLSLGTLAKKYQGVAYELTYDSNGILKGVNSGSKPVDVTNLETYEKEVYLGTCSKNVCKPDAGVTKVSVALEMTDSSGQKSQFSQDYPL